MRNILLVFSLVITGSILAQRDINSYQNLIVPAQFDFLKKPNQYNLNMLTKMYFEKIGFKVYVDNNVPKDLIANPCNNLYATVAEIGNFMKTKMQVYLKDCKKDTIYKSDVGSSKEKDFNLSYNLALRQALSSLEKLNYHYEPNQKEVVENESLKSSPEPQIKLSEYLYVARATSNGYELLDKQQKVFMKLLKTSRSDMYTAFKSGQQGALILKENGWFFEYYQGEQFISEPIEVKIPN